VKVGVRAFVVELLVLTAIKPHLAVREQAPITVISLWQNGDAHPGAEVVVDFAAAPVFAPFGDDNGASGSSAGGKVGNRENILLMTISFQIQMGNSAIITSW
jgi:hypothetical protein